jgi:hypothetical protein
MDALPVPSAPADFDHVLDLILKFSSGRLAPEQIHAIDRHLKQVQASEQGWWLADRLLSCQQSEARFFGALTFSVKLNNDQWQVTSISFLDSGLLSQTRASFRPAC